MVQQQDPNDIWFSNEVTEVVRSLVAELLGYLETSDLDDTTGFLDLGLDSVMAVDLAAKLNERYGANVAVADVFGHPSVDELAQVVVNNSRSSKEGISVNGRGSQVLETSMGIAGGSDLISLTAEMPGVSSAREDDLSGHAQSWSAPSRVQPINNPSDNRIAVIGMAGRFPGAPTVEALWDLLNGGHDAVGKVPRDRWNADEYAEGTAEFKGAAITTDQGGFISDIDAFDASFFGLSEREAAYLDPAQRLLLQSAWHALEDAGQDAHSLRGSMTGVFVGVSGSDYATLLQAQGESKIDAYYPTGTALNAAAGRLSYCFGLHGPSLAVDTACSSSLVAVHLAIQSLRNGECSAALVGGVNIISAPHNSVAVSRAHMLSPSGRCRTFSSEADGFVRAEAVGVLVLKRLEDALRDGDPIRGVFLGSAVGQDGASAGLTAPNPVAQQQVISAALSDAEVTPDQIDYLEAHGTGTPLGDPIELDAAWKAYSPGRTDNNRLLIGSVKTNIGHAESAAGIVAIIKVLLALRHELIPANLHCNELNPHIKWGSIGIDVVRRPRIWKRSDHPRIAGISGFGFSGTNAHLILMEPPGLETMVPQNVDRRLLLPLSAPDPEGLERQRNVWYHELLSSNGETGARSLLRAAASRASLPARLVASGASVAELCEELASRPILTTKQRPRIGMLFTGQGAQYLGMGRALYECDPVFRAVLDECDAALREPLGCSMIDMALYGSDPNVLNETWLTQPAIVGIELAAAEMWRSRGIVADAVIGHSVGEIAAAAYAGVLSRSDALKLIAARARLMSETPEGSMLSLHISEDAARGLIEQYGSEVDIAVVNGASTVVVAGNRDAIADFEACAKLEKIRTRQLNTTRAFHSRLMNPILGRLREEFLQLAYSKPKIPIIANLTGELAGPETYNAKYWVDHVRWPVKFKTGLLTLLELGIDTLLEVGPDKTLGSIVLSDGLIHSNNVVASMRRGLDSSDSVANATRQLYEIGADVNWKSVVGPANGEDLTMAPRYQFSDTKYSVPRNNSHVASENVQDGEDQPHWGVQMTSPLVPGTFYATSRSANFPRYLTDHRLYGTIVTPAASHLATLLSAVAGEGQDLVIENMLCPQALVIDEGEEYDLQVVLDAPNNMGVQELTIASLADPKKNVWTEHIVGQVKTTSSSDAVFSFDLDREEFIANAERHIDGETFYKYFQGLGYDLGPSFRWIADAWISGNKALLRYALPQYQSDAQTYELHPGLIDSCFQSIACFLVDENVVQSESLAIPYSADKIVFEKRPESGQSLWGEVTIRSAESLPNGRLQVDEADLCMIADTGDRIMSVERFKVRHAPRAVLESSIRPGFDGWVTAPSWVPAIISETATATLNQAVALVGADECDVDWCQALESVGANAVPLDEADLIIDVSLFCNPPEHPGTPAIKSLALSVMDNIKQASENAHYLMLASADPRVAEIRSAIFGMLQTVEVEYRDRKITRVLVEPDIGYGQVVASLCNFPEDSRLYLNYEGWFERRLVEVPPGTGLLPKTGTLLISGGVGALGLSTANAACGVGIERVVLMSRSASRMADDESIKRMTAKGVQVDLVCGDITKREDVARVLGTIADEKLTVFHLAGQTSDRAFINTTEFDFDTALNAKVEGLHVLADCLSEIGRRDTPIVVFSSASASVGSPGQAAYACANGAIDGFAEAAQANGESVVSVAWGPWVPESETGLAASSAVTRSAARLGVELIDDEVARHVLNNAPDCHANLVVTRIDAGQFASEGGYRAATQLPDFGEKSSVAGTGSRESKDIDAGWLSRELMGLEREDQHDRLVAAVANSVSEVLGESESLNFEQLKTGFTELGVDSIMIIDLRRSLGHALGRTLPATLAFDYPTVVDLASYLGKLLVETQAGEVNDLSDSNTPTVDAAKESVDQLDRLSFEELLRTAEDDLDREK